MYSTFWLGNVDPGFQTLRAHTGPFSAFRWTERRSGKRQPPAEFSPNSPDHGFAFMDTIGDGQVWVAVVDIVNDSFVLIDPPLRVDWNRHVPQRSQVNDSKQHPKLQHPQAANLLLDIVMPRPR